ncbi:MAG: putative hydro-lyase [Syntrophorhabdaceae bacterium]|nr:putative hydro-lyase [Syntrophorhabdaceae bacterium]
MKDITPKDFRRLVREGRWQQPTAGVSMGYAQMNLVILPERYAFDFLLFCQRNPKPCPVIEVLEKGQYLTFLSARDADIRTDIPGYNIYIKGSLHSTRWDISDIWQPDFVTFLIGCSFSFEDALMRAGISIRHIDEGKNVPMYITNLECIPAGIFHGPYVVTMRPIPRDRLFKAIQITSRYASVHGGPVHIGKPELIGIKDIDSPDFGDPVTIKEGEIPVFWACGVTPQSVVMNAKPDICITHKPGHMFVSDLLNEEIATF